MNFILSITFALMSHLSQIEDTTTFIVLSQPDWIMATSTSDRNEVYYIKSSYVKKEYSEIKVWVKVKSKTTKIKNKVYSNTEEKQLWMVNCSERQYKLLKSITYNSSGNVINSDERSEYAVPWDDIIPDSIGEGVVDKVCSLFND